MIKIYQITGRVEKEYSVTIRETKILAETDYSYVVIDPTSMDSEERIIPKAYLNKVTVNKQPFVGAAIIIYGVWATEDSIDLMMSELMMKIDATWKIMRNNFIALQSVIESKPKILRYDKDGNPEQNKRDS